MNIINYASPSEVFVAADEKGIVVWDNPVSVSFRVYDEKGKTVEFHVYYKMTGEYLVKNPN